MLRGINKQNIFEDEEDRKILLRVMQHYKKENSYKIYSYCLMDNHVHLLIEEVFDSISTVIKRISSSYVHWYNKKYERCGHLFQERFKSEPVETEESFLAVVRYIHQNPLKAGMVKRVEQYKWSSYGEYLRRATTVDYDFCLDIFSKNREKALSLFIEYNKAINTDKCLDYQEKIKLTDEQVREYFIKYNIINMSEIQSLKIEKRNKILKEIKGIEGVTVRQVSRITGISKSVIGRL